jgi:CO/xanthine dehydrogenase FAD-binding subunit
VTVLVRLPDYARPTTVAEAARSSARPGAMLLAGGTDLMNELRLGS